MWCGLSKSYRLSFRGHYKQSQIFVFVFVFIVIVKPEEVTDKTIKDIAVKGSKFFSN